MSVTSRKVTLGIVAALSLNVYISCACLAQGNFAVGDRITTTSNTTGSASNGVVKEVCGPPLVGCYRVLYDYQPKDASPILVRYFPEYPEQMYKEGQPPVKGAAPAAANPGVGQATPIVGTAKNNAPLPAALGIKVAQIPATGPIGMKGMHGAPRGPMPVPASPAAGSKPSLAFLKQLVQNKEEDNRAGRTILMDIHQFQQQASRKAVPDEFQPAASNATVIPINVRWTETTYGQMDNSIVEEEATWIVWQDPNGKWQAGMSGLPKMLGDIQTVNHPSILP